MVLTKRPLSCAAFFYASAVWVTEVHVPDSLIDALSVAVPRPQSQLWRDFKAVVEGFKGNYLVVRNGRAIGESEHHWRGYSHSKLGVRRESLDVLNRQSRGVPGKPSADRRRFRAGHHRVAVQRQLVAEAPKTRGERPRFRVKRDVGMIGEVDDTARAWNADSGLDAHRWVTAEVVHVVVHLELQRLGVGVGIEE